MKAEVYAGDRGYDDGEDHLFLWDRGLKSAISLNRYRTEKKDRYKEIWIELKADPDYGRGLRGHYKVERKFGEERDGTDWVGVVIWGWPSLPFRGI